MVQQCSLSIGRFSARGRSSSIRKDPLDGNVPPARVPSHLRAAEADASPNAWTRDAGSSASRRTPRLRSKRPRSARAHSRRPLPECRCLSPTVSQAARHNGHFGSSTSTAPGSIEAAAPESRRARRRDGPSPAQHCAAITHCSSCCSTRPFRAASHSRPWDRPRNRRRTCRGAGPTTS